MTNTINLSKNISLEILVNNRPITQHNHNKRIYIEGRSGSEYSIKIKNDNNVSVYAIISVDGISVIDGLPASENSIGFLVEKKSFITVPGWIVSEKAAAKFKFSEVKNSYSETLDTNNTNNLGVIGCIVIAEKVDEKESEIEELKEAVEKLKEKQDSNKYPVPYYPYYPAQKIVWIEPYYKSRPYYDPYIVYGTGIGGCSTVTGGGNIGNNGFGSDSLSIGPDGNAITNTWVTGGTGSLTNISYASSSIPCNHITGEATFAKASDSPLGTGFGDKTTLAASGFEKTFEIGEIIKSFVIFYDCRRNLEKLGIVFDKKKIEKTEPNPFPASKIKFCEPPEGWE